MIVEKRFEEDVCCDDCCMEIEGIGIPSGYDEGDILDGRELSGWMHQRKGACDANRQDERNIRMFEDGQYTIPPRAPLRLSS